MRPKFHHGGILKNGLSLQENKVCGFSTRNFAKCMLKTTAFTQRMQTANNFLYIFQHDHFFINRMTYMTFLSPLRCKHTMALHRLQAPAAAERAGAARLQIPDPWHVPCAPCHQTQPISRTLQLEYGDLAPTAGTVT